jgi:hypothetical protein
MSEEHDRYTIRYINLLAESRRSEAAEAFTEAIVKSAERVDPEFGVGVERWKSRAASVATFARGEGDYIFPSGIVVLVNQTRGTVVTTHTI